MMTFMILFRKYFLILLLFIYSFPVASEGKYFVKELKNNDGSRWVIEKENEGYNLKYVDSKGEGYNNRGVITSDVGEDNILLINDSPESVSVLMTYTRDNYVFKFSSGEIPNLLSACKQIKLPSVNNDQAVSLLMLCVKNSVIYNLTLSNMDADKLLASDNLELSDKVKTIIGTNKAFLYDDNKVQYTRKPYLIKGDVIEVLDYENSFLKVRYITRSKRDVIGWVRFEDIL